MSSVNVTDPQHHEDGTTYISSTEEKQVVVEHGEDVSEGLGLGEQAEPTSAQAATELVGDPGSGSLVDDLSALPTTSEPGLKEVYFLPQTSKIFPWTEDLKLRLKDAKKKAFGLEVNDHYQLTKIEDEKKAFKQHWNWLMSNIRNPKDTTSRPSAFVKNPLVLTAENVVRFTPFAISPAVARAVAHDPQAPPTSASVRDHLTAFRELMRGRPPPSSPQQPVDAAQLSMPTLPSLRQTSLPHLIEGYREERKQNPAAFDDSTMTMEQDCIAAKVERGGEPYLLDTEMTADLASRLDAQAIEDWFIVKAAQKQESSTASNVQSNNGNNHDLEEENFALPSPIDDDSDTVTRDAKITGKVAHKTHVTKHVFHNGAERHVHETWIKITKVVNVANDNGIIMEDASGGVATAATTKGKGKATDHSNSTDYDPEEDALDDIIKSLVKLRGDQGEKLSDDLLKTLEETQLRLKALRDEQ